MLATGYVWDSANVYTEAKSLWIFYDHGVDWLMRFLVLDC